MPVDAETRIWNLQATLVFAIFVAGKSEIFARGVAGRFLESHRSPFETIRGLAAVDGALEAALRRARSGSYTRLALCLPRAAELDPETCTIEELEAVHGIGPKTARAFVLWTRPGTRCAVLDTHILKWLRALGHAAPKSTPTGKRYRELEQAVLREADRRGMTPADLDAQVWASYAKRSGVEGK